MSCCRRPRQANLLTAVTSRAQASTLHMRLHCVCVQFLVDHTTPASVLEAISKAVEHHYQQHPGEFESKKSVLFRDCSDPLKIMLAVSFTFSHCGGVANPSRRALCMQSLVWSAADEVWIRCLQGWIVAAAAEHAQPCLQWSVASLQR